MFDQIWHKWLVWAFLLVFQSNPAIRETPPVWNWLPLVYQQKWPHLTISWRRCLKRATKSYPTMLLRMANHSVQLTSRFRSTTNCSSRNTAGNKEKVKSNFWRKSATLIRWICHLHYEIVKGHRGRHKLKQLCCYWDWLNLRTAKAFIWWGVILWYLLIV